MDIPTGEQVYLEAIVSHKVKGQKKEFKASVKSAQRTATPESHTAYIRSKSVDVGFRCVKICDIKVGDKKYAIK
jgi:hypothetical protein